MSGVIWGAVKLNSGRDITGFGENIKNKFGMYKLDKISCLELPNVTMGCGLMHITKESLNEVLPFFDQENKLLITADAIIDNREELLQSFGIDKALWGSISDSQIILKAYIKWGKNVPKYLLGDFAFAIWDDNKQELVCARDHVGSRSLYYYKTEDVFAFCTVIRPLFEIFDNRVEINERWTAEFFALPDGIQEYECNETIYKNILQFPVAKTVTVGSGKFETDKYWDPIKDVEPIVYKTDQEYVDAFNKIFFEAVKCRLRGTGEVGIMLSGGLDSGSVAAVAAKVLSEQGKLLKAYCSVPMDGFEDYTSKFDIPNESEYVDSIVKHSGNIEINYCKCEGINALTYTDEYLEVLEQPYKIMENIIWIYEIYKKAASVGCKVMLKGQFGNVTISRGDFISNALTLFREGKWITIAKEIIEGSNFHKIPKSFVAKQVIAAIVPNRLKLIKRKISGKSKNFIRFKFIPVRKDVIDRWRIEERFDKKNILPEVEKTKDFYGINDFIVDDFMFAHIGVYDTKFGLASGVIMRDPARDRRVIEFCLKIPYNQFVRNGVERFLIRRAMKDILPDKVRLNHKLKGMQGVDCFQRLSSDIDKIMDEFSKVLTEDYIKYYLDADKIKERINDVKSRWNHKSKETIKLILVLLVFSRFYNKEISDVSQKAAKR